MKIIYFNKKLNTNLQKGGAYDIAKFLFATVRKFRWVALTPTRKPATMSAFYMPIISASYIFHRPIQDIYIIQDTFVHVISVINFVIYPHIRDDDMRLNKIVEILSVIIHTLVNKLEDPNILRRLEQSYIRDKPITPADLLGHISGPAQVNTLASVVFNEYDPAKYLPITMIPIFPQLYTTVEAPPNRDQQLINLYYENAEKLLSIMINLAYP